jgi:NAD-dependent SIR2 family protein deacetylase
VKSLAHAAAAPAGSLEELAGFIERHGKVALLTGAGMSTASGIPDYRDSDGVRRGKAPIQGPDFRRDEALRRRYWARSMVGYPTLSLAEPNAGHRAIAALQAHGRLAGLVTQNVDGLHQRAGSAGITELHGNIHTVACLACDARFARSAIQSLLADTNPAMLGSAATALPDGDADLEPASLAGFRVPDCPYCGGMLQPDVVFFGDGVSRGSTEAAEATLADANALLVVGSSLVVFSGYRLCRMAAEAGKPVAALNLGKTRADPLLTLKTEASAEQALPQLARLLGMTI